MKTYYENFKRYNYLMAKDKLTSDEIQELSFLEDYLDETHKAMEENNNV